MEGSYWVGDLLSTGRVSRDRREIRLVWSLSLFNPDTMILGRAGQYYLYRYRMGRGDTDIQGRCIQAAGGVQDRGYEDHSHWVVTTGYNRCC